VALMCAAVKNLSANFAGVRCTGAPDEENQIWFAGRNSDNQKPLD